VGRTTRIVESKPSGLAPQAVPTRVAGAGKTLAAAGKAFALPWRSFPLGPTVYSDVVNFSVFSKHSSGVEILLFDHPAARRIGPADGEPAGVVGHQVGPCAGERQGTGSSRGRSSFCRAAA
jgi:hypothetical protein